MSNDATDPTDGGTSGDKPTPEELEADIARQREELSATVTELQSRLDVKAKAQAKAHEIKDVATTESGKPRPELIVAAVLVVAGVAGLVVWRVRARRG